MSRNKVLTPYKTGCAGSQYLTVQIAKKNIKVHRLVAETFLPMRIGATQVNHIDGNKLNNAASNLEWVTPSENVKHAYRVLGLEPLKTHSWGGGGHPGRLGALSHLAKPLIAILPDGEGQTFDCVKSAAAALGLQRESIGRVANGVYQTTKGHRFHWVPSELWDSNEKRELGDEWLIQTVLTLASTGAIRA